MRKIQFLSLMILAFIGFGIIPKAFAYVETGSSTVLLFHFNEGDGTETLDESTNAISGTLGNGGGGGAANPTWVAPNDVTAGRFGSALNFTVNSFVREPDTAVLDLGGGGSGFVIEAWIRPSTTGAGIRWIVSKWRNANAGQSYGLRQNAATVEFCTGTTAVAGTCLATGNVLTANQLVHVAGVFDNANDTRAIYINGVRQATGAFVGDVGNSGTDFMIGGRRTTGNTTGFTEDFEGTIDEVRIRTTLPATGITTEPIFNPGVVINRVTHSPASGSESFAIYNGGGATITMTGWVFEQCSGAANYIPPGGRTIAAGVTKTVVVGAGTDETPANTWYTANGTGGTDISTLAASDCLRAYGQNTTRDATSILDFVAWGADADTGDDQAVTAGLWRSGTYVSTLPTLNSQAIELFIKGQSAITPVGDNEEGVADWNRHPHTTIFGEGSASANGDPYSATAVRNITHRYFIEVPSGTARLRAELWDADVGRAGTASEESGNRDSVIGTFNTTTVYRLIDPSGTTVATFTGSATAGMDNAFMTPNGFRVETPAQGLWRLDVDGTVGANGDDKSTLAIRVPGLYVYGTFVGYGKSTNAGLVPEFDLFYPKIHSGCSLNIYDYDYDNGLGGNQGQILIRSLWGTGTFSQTLAEGVLSNNDIWAQNNVTGFAADFTQQDKYGIYEIEAQSIGVIPTGNQGNVPLIEIRNYLGGAAADAGDADTDVNAQKIYLPTDNGAPPDVPYLIQFLYVSSGPSTPTIGLTTRINVNVVVLDQSQKSTTGHTITARLPNLAQVTYVGGSATVTQGSIVQPAGGATAGNIVWTIPTLSGTGAQLNYEIDVTPTAAGTLNLTGVPGGGVEGTNAAYTSAHNTAETLGPICQLQATVGASLATWVSLSDFRGRAFSDAVLLEWETGAEIDNLGFFVSYSESPVGPYQRISGLINGLGATLIGGKYYFQHHGKNEGYYILEDIDFAGVLTRHGPIAVEENVLAGSFAQFNFDPNDYSGGGGNRANQETYTEDSGESGIQTYANVDIRHTDLGDKRGLRIRIKTPDLVVSDGVTQGKAVKSLTIDGYQNLAGVSCAPMLPEKALLIPVEAFQLKTEVIHLESTAQILNAPVELKPTYAIDPQGKIESSQCQSSVLDSSKTEMLPKSHFSLGQPVEMNGQWFATLNVYPVRYREQSGELIHMKTLDLMVTYSDPIMPKSHSISENSLKVQASILAEGNILKVQVGAKGLYRISGADLKVTGLKKYSDTSQLQLFYLGEEIPVLVLDGGDGNFDDTDHLVFYGEENTDPHAEKLNAYWLRAGVEKGARMNVLDATPKGGALAAEFFWHSEKSESNVFYSAPFPRNAPANDRWYGQYLLAPTGGFVTLAVSDLAPVVGAEAVVRVFLQGVTSYAGVNPDHHVSVWVGGYRACDANWDGDLPHVAECVVPISHLADGDNRIDLKMEGGSTAVPYDAVFLDKVELVYPRRFKALQNSLVFRTGNFGDYQVTHLNTPNQLLLIDHTDSKQPAVMENFQIDALGNLFFHSPDRVFGAQLTLKPIEQINWPEAIDLVQPNDLLGQQSGGDYVVISPESLMAEAKALADYRQARGYRVVTVGLEGLSNVFDYGRKSPVAIRRFIQHARMHWKVAPQYVVLVGRGTFDPKEYLAGSAQDNLMPVDFAEGQFMQVPSDFRYADADGDGRADVMLGRLPVRTAEELKSMIERIMVYEQAPRAAWETHVTTVADDVDMAGDEIFLVTAQKISKSLESRYSVDLITESSAGGALEAKQQIIRSMGVSNVVNWVGHGSIDRWGSENILNRSDVAAMSNAHWPIVVAMNCLNGNATYPGYAGIAEEMVRAPQGGAIAFLSLSGLAEPHPQQIFNLGFFNGPFLKKNGVAELAQTSEGKFSASTTATLGQAFLGGLMSLPPENVAAKEVLDSAVLFGDPALAIRVNPPKETYVVGSASGTVFDQIPPPMPSDRVEPHVESVSASGCQAGVADAGWIVFFLAFVFFPFLNRQQGAERRKK